jgi:Nucleotide modification associated domain 3
MMNIIFSRKGVDSAAGRCASPIVGGRPLSLPIPTSMPTSTRYGDLAPPLPSLARDLSGGRLTANRPCHLDPDIDAAALAGGRPNGWRGALGQVSTSLSHLRNNHVGGGDLFLFWGLFREAERIGGVWRYVGRKRHVIFGWLQVDAVIDLGADGSHILSTYPWLARHPHVRPGWNVNNAVYLARRVLSFGERERPGCGVFEEPIALTVDGASTPSFWAIPAWLDPTLGGVGMTYHPPSRWLGDGRVAAAARGQEFVADVRDRADVKDWLSRHILKTKR